VNQYTNPAYAKQLAETKAELVRLRNHYEDDSDVSEKPRAWQEQMRNNQASKN